MLLLIIMVKRVMVTRVKKKTTGIKETKNRNGIHGLGKMIMHSSIIFRK